MNHIFYMHFNTSISDSDKDLCMPFLPEDRINRVNRYKTREASLKCMLTGLFLRYGIEMSGFTIELDDMMVEENGKPYIKGNPFYYNLSHSKDVVALMISDTPCGIDIQEMVPAKDNLAKRILHENEFALYQNAESELVKTHLLTRFWCGKESYVKLTATGIACKLSALDFSSCITGDYDNKALYVPALDAYILMDNILEHYDLSVCKKEQFSLDSIKMVSQAEMFSWFLHK